MRRLFVAAIIGLLWTAVFALSLFAQSGPGDLPLSPASTIPPFEPPTGATITVTTGQDNLADNGDCTLREAIQAANTDTAVDACPAGNGTDLILLPAGGYGLSLEGRSEDENATGDLDIRSSLVISGAGSAGTVIDANQTDRALHILTGTVEIRGVTVQNGRAADGDATGCGPFLDCPGGDGESGGGIHNSGLSTLFDVVVQNNRSGDNGGIPYGGGSGGDGGGVMNIGRLEMFEIQVVKNMAGKGNPAGDGGGIVNTGTLVGHDLILARNGAGISGPIFKGIGLAGSGGGIYNSGTLTVTKGRIYSNFGRNGVANTENAWVFSSDIHGNAGGVFNRGYFLLSGSSVEDNHLGSGDSGGGIYNTGTLSLVNSTVSNNRSGDGSEQPIWLILPPIPGGDGAGIMNWGSLLIESSTIAYNQTGTGYCRSPDDCSSGSSGGGLANNGGAVTIHNSLFAENSVADGGSGPDCTGIVSSQGPNLIGDPAGCTLAGADDDIRNQHAFLGPLTDNGGPTPTHALLPYSPALDAGSCTDISGAPVLTDQRGELRPQGAGCDLGAFESPLSTILLPVIRYLPVIQNKPN
ncbi:MAG: CSLREA domain-containing protein [Caldilineaceae bacterium]